HIDATLPHICPARRQSAKISEITTTYKTPLAMRERNKTLPSTHSWSHKTTIQIVSPKTSNVNQSHSTFSSTTMSQQPYHLYMAPPVPALLALAQALPTTPPPSPAFSEQTTSEFHYPTGQPYEMPGNHPYIYNNGNLPYPPQATMNAGGNEVPDRTKTERAPELTVIHIPAWEEIADFPIITVRNFESRPFHSRLLTFFVAFKPEAPLRSKSMIKVRNDANYMVDFPFRLAHVAGFLLDHVAFWAVQCNGAGNAAFLLLINRQWTHLNPEESYAQSLLGHRLFDITSLRDPNMPSRRELEEQVVW
ncbi:hypothetical protein BDW22DRAFT_1477415, partial [Trametopsis cervina]